MDLTGEVDLDGGQSQTNMCVKDTDGQESLISISSENHGAEKTVYPSRTPEGQAFARAVRANAEVHAIFRKLGNSEKDNFRNAWIQHRDWEFVRESKLWSNDQLTSSTTSGCYMTFTQVARAYGSADNQQCIEQAERYTKICKERGGKWVEESGDHGTRYWWSSSEYSERHNEKKATKVDLIRTENLWEQKTMERNALVSFAASKRKRASYVSMDEVRESDLGVEGWAAAQITPGMHSKQSFSSKKQRKSSEGEVEIKKAKENFAIVLKADKMVLDLRKRQEDDSSLAW